MEEIKLSESESYYFDGVLPYICDARLDNVLSKRDIPTVKMFGVIMGELYDDAVDEWELDNSEELCQGKHIKLLKKECALVMKPRWLDIIDG